MTNTQPQTTERSHTMQYDYYLSNAEPKRYQRALDGLRNGDLVVEDLTFDGANMTALVRSGDHGYECTVTWEGVHCDCKDYGHRLASCKHLLAAMAMATTMQLRQAA